MSGIFQVNRQIYVNFAMTLPLSKLEIRGGFSLRPVSNNKRK